METARSLYARRWVRYALTLLLLAAVVLKVHPSELGRAASSVRVESLAIALALTIPFILLKAWRWFLMLRAAGVAADFCEALLSLVGGMGLALLTPARLGELVRVAYIRDPRKWRIGGLVMIDKAFDVLVLTGLSVAGAWLLLRAWAGVTFTVVTAIGLLIVFRPAAVAGGLQHISARLPFSGKIDQVLGSLEALTPATAAAFLAVTVLSFVVVLVQFAIILSSWHPPSLSLVVLTFPIVILTNILPITIGGLGVREAAAALLLSHFGVSAADAALAAFLMFAINTAVPGLVGALLLPAAPPSAERGIATTADRP